MDWFVIFMISIAVIIMAGAFIGQMDLSGKALKFFEIFYGSFWLLLFGGGIVFHLLWFSGVI